LTVADTTALGVAVRSRRPWSPAVLVPLAILAAFLCVPLLMLVSTAFNTGDPQQFPARQFGIDNFVEVLDHLDWIENTLIISSCGTLIAIAIAVVVSWSLHRTEIPGRKLLDLLIAIPYPLGPLVGALAWHQLGSTHHGLLNDAYRWLTGSHDSLINMSSLTAITVITALFEAPVAILMIGAAMQRMDPSLEESSAMLGGGMLRTAVTITLPLMLPAILSAALFLFVSMGGAFAIPAILGADERIYVVTTAIYQLFQSYPPRYPLAAAMGSILVVIALLALWLHGFILRGKTYAVISGKSYRPRRIKLRQPIKGILIAMLWLYVFVAVVLPIGTLLLAALQRTSDVSFDPANWTTENFRFVALDFETTRKAIANSLILAVATGAVGTAAATALAWVVYRSRSAGRGLLEQATMIPQAFPHVIFAVGFLWTILLLPLPIYNTLSALLLAFIILFLPLAFRSMSGVIVQLSPSLEEASRVSGAGWFTMFRTITVPLLGTGVLSTWALLFMVSVREVSASVFLSGPDSQVLGPAILSFWDSGGMPRVSALAIIQAVIVLLALLIVRWAVSRSRLAMSE
jgi:iron(III) transport system permease protein